MIKNVHFNVDIYSSSFLIKNYHISKKNFYRIFFALDKMYHIKKPVLDKLAESFRAILNSS